MQAKKRKLLFIIDNLGGGGAENTLKLLLDELDYSKYDIDLLVLVYIGELCEQINTNVNVIPLYHSKEEWQQGFRDHSYDSLIHSKLRKDYDVQISFLEGFSVVVAAYYGNPFSKKMAWIHCDPLWRKDYIMEFKSDYLLMDEIIFVSHGCLESFVSLFNESISSKCYVINNPMDIKKIHELAQVKVDYNKQKFMVLGIGRLSNEKGFRDLIMAHHRLIQEGIDHELILIGDGVQRQALVDMIRKLNLEASVKLLGYIENPYPFIDKCDLFVSSSTAESFSLVIAEALILKKPVLATMTKGATELLKYKYGLLVDHTTEALYLGLKSLICSDDHRRVFIKQLTPPPVDSLSHTIRKIESHLNN